MFHTLHLKSGFSADMCSLKQVKVPNKWHLYKDVLEAFPSSTSAHPPRGVALAQAAKRRAALLETLIFRDKELTNSTAHLKRANLREPH